jgi:hypothetical protein
MSLSNVQESTTEQQDSSSLEKTVEVSQVPEDSNDSTSERHGDFRVVAIAGSKDVKLASDGATVLIPQPSDDPDDVLNICEEIQSFVIVGCCVAGMDGISARM